MLAGLVLAVLLSGCGDPSPQKVKIGANLELTGDIQGVGASAKNAAVLFFEQINAEGGVVFPDGPAPAELVVRDNGAKATQAAAAAQQLIAGDEVVAMIGPNSDTCAIAAGEIAEKLKCVMVSPWSTSPETTRDKSSGAPKRHVFRACFTETAQARALANFALANLGAKKAAVFHDRSSAEATAQASAFRDAFTAGGGTVDVFESQAADDRKFAVQLAKIRDAAPDVIFLPARHNDITAIVREARRLGLKAPFLGTDAWNSPALITAGGAALDGSYFCSQFSVGDSDEAREFSAAYSAKYGHMPDDVAALTYDACGLLVEALEKSGQYNRGAVREALAQIRDYRGVTGTFHFEPGCGDPLKSAAILQIKGGTAVRVTNARP